MRKPISLSTILGWATFALVIAGGPILGAVQSALGVQLPSFTLPGLIAALLLANAAVAAAQRAGRPQPSPYAQPLPGPAQAESPSPPADMPVGPRFEPVVSLPLVLIGVAGAITLALLAVLFFAAAP